MNTSMRRTWERIRTVPGLGRDVLAVTVLIVGAMVSLGVMYPKMTTAFPWQNRQHVHVEFARVPGVNPDSSQKVTMAGVIVGQISGWEATDHGTAILDLNIDGTKKVYQNARAILRPKNVLNDMTVEINPGGPPAPLLAEDGLIPETQTDRPIQVDEILDNLDVKTQAAVTSLLVQSDAALVRAPDQLPGGLRATQATLDSIRPVMQSLDTRRQKIATLVTSLARISQALGRNDVRVAQLIDSTQQTLSVLGDNDKDLRDSLDQLPGLNDSLRSAMDKVQPLTTQVNATVDNLGNASKELPKSLDRFEDTVDDLDRTVKSAKPFVAEAKPVIADLRPFVDDAEPAFDDLVPVSRSLTKDSQTLVTYMSNIQAFVYNTRSVFGAGDGPQKDIIRGHFVCRVPDCAGVLPGNAGGFAPGPRDGTEGINR
ncbi:MAG: phospholipid/cholesterol/gamma-HCH transport system substrate-binding protein [Pseudonocardiales bacterium]|jgi:phospholipid/cholesterol/gamma-HCH transport system substrate-binding protein|nr:phospholipid/cholesterol/gamma-HCH transport system substrate-binding protein [Pseudonocardiales bacterium]